MECVSCKGNEGTFKFKSIEVRSVMTPGKSGFLRKDRKPATRTQSLGNYRKFSENNRRFVIAWDLVSRSAPKREGLESLYFIPITSATETMKREDFIKYYGLTHDNADEFYRMIHSKGKHSRNTQTEDETDERIPNTDLIEEEMRA